jgi:hypothetical protein
MKPTFYLDTNVYDYLVDVDRKAASLLCELVDMNKCRVLGSVELLEEIAGAASKGIETQGRYRLFWSIVGWDVLDYAFRIFEAELRKGSQLSIREACLPKPFIAESRNFSTVTAFLKSVHEEIREEKVRYRDHARTFREDFDGKLVDAAEKTGLDLQTGRKGMRHASIDESVAEEWFQRWFAKRIGSSRKSSLRNLPCARAWVSIQVARMYRRHSNQPSTDKQGDLFDNSHYMLSAFAGTLVTEDGKFKTTVDKIDWRPITVIDAAEFCARIQSMATE